MTPSLSQRLRLLVITDAGACGARDLITVARAALRGGARALQLRDKRASARELVGLGDTLRSVTNEFGALLFVNDRLDVALAVGADGAHLGDDDLPIVAARRVVPAGFLLGRSVDDRDQARSAEAEGADYLGLGPVFATASKTDTGPVLGLDGLAAVVGSVGVPLIAIGGIDAERAGPVARTRVDGIAVIGAVMAAPDPEVAAARLLREFSSGAASGFG